MPNLSGLPYNEEISWGQWWSGYGDITLKCSNSTVQEIDSERPLGWNKRAYADITTIDIFVRDNSGSYPTSLLQMSNFIQKAIAEQRSLPQDNITEMFVSSIEEVNDPTDESYEDNSLFHLRMNVAVKYWR